MSKVEKVLIDIDELDRLYERDNWLSALEEAGIDNWNGWEEAIRIKREMDGDDEDT